MIKKRKKVLISCSAAKSILKFRGKLIEELLKENDVFVFTPRIQDPTLRRTLLEMGIVVYENDLNRNNISIFSDLRYIISLIKVIREVGPDVFFAYTFKPLIFGSIVASVFKVKHIVAMLTGLGYNFADSEKSLTKTATQSLLKFSLRFNKHLRIVFQNEDDRQELISRRIINDSSNTFVVNGSGVDLDFYQYSTPNVNPVRFLLISRLIKAKGVEEFMAAAKIVHNRYPDMKISIVGSFEGNQIDSVKHELFEEITKSDFIEFTSWVDDVRPYIERASVVVLPSYREGTPRSILEGMSMGRAIITTDTPGCRQTVNTNHGKVNGRLIKVKSVDDIVTSMEFFINNPEQVTQYGRNGRLYAEEKYDVNKVNKDMINILFHNRMIDPSLLIADVQ